MQLSQEVSEVNSEREGKQQLVARAKRGTVLAIRWLASGLYID